MKIWALTTLFAFARGFAVAPSGGQEFAIEQVSPYTTPFQATVHRFESSTPSVCAYESGPDSAENALVFIAGFGGGPHTMSVARKISEKLTNSPKLGYSLFEIRMRSSFDSIGNSGVLEDVQDIKALVKYLRTIGRKKIVLLGHSTGCQDIMTYNKLKDEVPPVDGFILQGPISDREAFKNIIAKPEEMLNYLEALEYARENEIAAGVGSDEILGWMPRWLIPKAVRNLPFTIYRFLSLSTVGGDDDFFSPDLSSEQVSTIWKSLTKPAMVLHSGNDEFVRSSVDKKGLISEWKAAGPKVSSLSGVIPNANHAVSEDAPAAWFCQRIGKFLQTI
ncbi:hypothetical protein Cpir12675_000530 [Ceratocystis pirilliformis]|uniref:Uncharacterized protein n=1 Tax=Ceratocystis pirilliformis TaxID=259994 RepID=A0ABR3ZM17_9PEZI